MLEKLPFEPPQSFVFEVFHRVFHKAVENSRELKVKL
jgi:hypothetical protein